MTLEKLKKLKTYASRSIERRHAAQEAAEQQPPDEALTIKEASPLLKLSERQVWQLCKEGKLPAVKIGNSWRLFRHEIMGSEVLKATQKGD